jgi:hypothetical protein
VAARARSRWGVIDAAVRCALPLALRKRAAVERAWSSGMKAARRSVTPMFLNWVRQGLPPGYVENLEAAAAALRDAAPVVSVEAMRDIRPLVMQITTLTEWGGREDPLVAALHSTAIGLDYVLGYFPPNRASRASAERNVASARHSATWVIRIVMMMFPRLHHIGPIGPHERMRSPDVFFESWLPAEGGRHTTINTAAEAAIHEAVIRTLCEEVDAEPRLLLPEYEAAANDFTKLAVERAIAWWHQGRL